jgi:hypothetical protein
MAIVTSWSELHRNCIDTLHTATDFKCSGNCSTAHCFNKLHFFNCSHLAVSFHAFISVRFRMPCDTSHSLQMTVAGRPLCVPPPHSITHSVRCSRAVPLHRRACRSNCALTSPLSSVHSLGEYRNLQPMFFPHALCVCVWWYGLYDQPKGK